MKCFGERDVATIKIVPIKRSDGTYSRSASRSFTKILALECPNVIPTRWIPDEGLKAISTAGKTFSVIYLSEGIAGRITTKTKIFLSVLWILSTRFHGLR